MQLYQGEPGAWLDRGVWLHLNVAAGAEPGPQRGLERRRSPGGFPGFAVREVT